MAETIAGRSSMTIALRDNPVSAGGPISDGAVETALSGHAPVRFPGTPRAASARRHGVAGWGAQRRGRPAAQRGQLAAAHAETAIFRPVRRYPGEQR